MSMTERDRKVIMILAPVLLLAAYWFLLLSPKREEATVAKDELVVQEQRRDLAQQNLAQLESSKADFAADYAEIVRLGKAVPATVDMPTLLVQLEAAAAGTKIEFLKIAAGERVAAAPAPAAPPAPGTGDGSQPAAAGGEPAQSAPGAAAETAGNTVVGANDASAAAEQSGIDPADTATSTAARDGALPVGGGVASDGSVAPVTSSPLETVPLTLEFSGDFFDLANFFHKLKRYVESSKDDLLVRGRLMTVDGISLASELDSFPKLTAEVTASVYLAPKAQGPTAGATPGGPSTTVVSGEPTASATTTAAATP